MSSAFSNNINYKYENNIKPTLVMKYNNVNYRYIPDKCGGYKNNYDSKKNFHRDIQVKCTEYKNNYDSKKNFHRDIMVKCEGYENNFNAKKTFYDCIDTCHKCGGNMIYNDGIYNDPLMPPWNGIAPDFVTE